MPKVSIIVPVFNVEKYIERCARSLLGQSLQDIEFIFVNDCSSDNSMTLLNQVIEEYPQRQEQIKIINHHVNQGLNQARITGLRASHGEYIAWCDSDDYVANNMYKDMYEFCKAKNYDFVICDNYIKTVTSMEYFSATDIPLNKKSLLRELLTGRIPGHLWNTITKREIATDSRILFPCNSIIEDLCTVIQYTIYAERIGFLKKALYYYCQRSDSLISINESKCKALHIISEAEKNHQIINEVLKKNNLANNYSQELTAGEYAFKNITLPYIDHMSDCSFWVNSYKKINWKIFTNKYISIGSKLRSLSLLLRIYPLIKKITGRKII